MASNYIGQSNLPRGIRNNNPGNIKDDGTAWQGMSGSDGTFVIFVDMSWGTRAMATALTHMIEKGYNTIDKLIRQWSVTDQDAYVANVASRMGLGPTAILPLDMTSLASLMRAMITQEDGDASSYVTDQDISEGIGKMNNSLLTLFKAGVVAAQQNPDTTIGLLLAAAVGLYFVFRKR